MKQRFGELKVVVDEAIVLRDEMNCRRYKETKIERANRTVSGKDVAPINQEKELPSQAAPSVPPPGVAGAKLFSEQLQ